MKASRTRHGWVHMFTTHRPTLTLQLHNFDLSRTSRTALLRGNWQDFNWHDSSRGPSAIAELLVTLDWVRICPPEGSFISVAGNGCWKIFDFWLVIPAPFSIVLFAVAYFLDFVEDLPTERENYPHVWKSYPFSDCTVLVGPRKFPAYSVPLSAIPAVWSCVDPCELLKLWTWLSGIIMAHRVETGHTFCVDINLDKSMLFGVSAVLIV